MRFSWRYKQTSIKSLVIVRNGRLSCSEKPSVELVLVLFPKAVPRREELPTALLVHFPHVRFLKQRISQGLWFIWHIWLLGAFQKWALINNLVSMYMLTHLCPVISIQLIHLTDIYSLTHNHIQYISLYNNKKDKYTVNISCKLIAKYIWNKKYCTMMVILSGYVSTRTVPKAISHQLYTTSSRMDYLAGVLCFVFVDEVHQKEPETHIETFKKKKTQTLTILSLGLFFVVFFWYSEMEICIGFF